MKIRINLIQAWQIIIINPKYTLYTKKQVKRKTTRIKQINYTIVHILIYYNIKIEVLLL